MIGMIGQPDIVLRSTMHHVQSIQAGLTLPGSNMIGQLGIVLRSTMHHIQSIQASLTLPGSNIIGQLGIMLRSTMDTIHHIQNDHNGQHNEEAQDGKAPQRQQ